MNRLVECVYARTVDSFLYYFRKSGAQTVNSFNVGEMWKKGEKKPPNVIENHKNEEIKEAKGYTYETCEPNEREKKIRKGTIL